MESRHCPGLVVFLPSQSTGGRFIPVVWLLAVPDTVSVYTWNQSTGKVTDILTGHNGPVCVLDFHPNESLPLVEEISTESDPIPSYLQRNAKKTQSKLEVPCHTPDDLFGTLEPSAHYILLIFYK